MRNHMIVLILCLVIGLGVSEALAQTMTTAAIEVTTSTQTATTTPPSTSTSNSTQGAFDQLSPGGQKIATALCNAQTGGCPSSRTSRQSGSSSTRSTRPRPLTRDQIASMKQDTGWGRVFKQMQTNGQIPSGVKNLGQVVSGRYQAHSGGAGSTTITTASGKSLAAGNSGSQFGKGHVERDSSVSNASGGHSGLGGDHSGASSHGGGRGK